MDSFIFEKGDIVEIVIESKFPILKNKQGIIVNRTTESNINKYSIKLLDYNRHLAWFKENHLNLIKKYNITNKTIFNINRP